MPTSIQVFFSFSLLYTIFIEFDNNGVSVDTSRERLILAVVNEKHVSGRLNVRSGDGL